MLPLHLDMHRIGEAIARVVADGDLNDATVSINVAAQYSKAGASAGDPQSRSHLGSRGHRLNILRHPRNLDARKPLKLPEKRWFSEVDRARRFGKVRVNIGLCQSNRALGVAARTNAAKLRPFPAAGCTNLLSQIARQSNANAALKDDMGVAGILQNLVNVRQRLVQRTAARRRRLDDRARTALTLDHAFRLERAQRLAHRKSADAILATQHDFGRELFGLWKFIPQNARPQIIRQFDIPGLTHRICHYSGQISSPVAITL